MASFWSTSLLSHMATKPHIDMDILGQHKTSSFQLARYIPITSWARRYNRDQLAGDLMAGIIVAIMLVPQSMAYALLAGLPPQVGLYASIVPVILYGIFGTSRTLAVGPVAMVSLLVASSVGPLAAVGSSEYIQLALTLALMAGVIQALMGLLRVGFIVNFLSHPVLSGFTSAAALIIGFSQLKHLLGIAVPRTEYFYEQLLVTMAHLPETNLITLAIGGGSMAILLFFKYQLGRLLQKWSTAEKWIIPLTKSAPLVVVVLGTVIVWAFQLNETAGVGIVGAVPAGFPPLTIPTLNLSTLQMLLPAAVAISLVGYMESISVSKSLASKRREKIDPNQELIALGMASIGAAFTGGYPVTGGISRSVVNYSAGARTGLASIITALLVAFTVLLLTPIFYFLPNAVLAAIIVVAVAGMVDVKTLRHIWHYYKVDGLTLLITFVAVLMVGVESGILYGVASAMLLYIWRTSRPHVAIVGRLADSEIYRNIQRYEVQTWPSIIAMRIDESLYFANTKYLEDTVLQQIAENPEIKQFLLIGTAINFIDASALETLQELGNALNNAGVEFHLAAIKGPVLDRLKGSGLIEQIGADRVHLSTHDAIKQLGYVTE